MRVLECLRARYRTACNCLQTYKYNYVCIKKCGVFKVAAESAASMRHDERCRAAHTPAAWPCRRRKLPIRTEIRDRGEDRRTPGISGMKTESVMLVLRVVVGA
jgi:hypothetical protein